jgi:CheY-like chemotaxis protein
MRQRILVVDDSATVLAIIKSALLHAYEVETATGGEEGLEQARRSLPDLIVTDSLMPGLDGFGLLRRLQDDPATSAIPLILLTSEDVREQPAPGGVQPAAVLTKSMDMEPLLQAVRSALESVPL